MAGSGVGGHPSLLVAGNREHVVKEVVMRIGRWRLITAVLGTSFALTAQPASGHDHRPPRNPVLTVGAKRQPGRSVEVAWRERIDENECEFGHGWNVTTFPSAIPYSSGSHATLVLRKKSPPREWSLQAWTSVTRKGRPKGEPKLVPALLVPEVGRAPDPRWTLRFVPPRFASHLYLRLDVFWADEEGCSRTPDLGSQMGGWTYHLRLRG